MEFVAQWNHRVAVATRMICLLCLTPCTCGTSASRRQQLASLGCVRWFWREPRTDSRLTRVPVRLSSQSVCPFEKHAHLVESTAHGQLAAIVLPIIIFGKTTNSFKVVPYRIQAGVHSELRLPC